LATNDTSDKYWKVEAYTNGFEIVILGEPNELPAEHPLAHDCDSMGCSSVNHVILRIPILEPIPELVLEMKNGMI
jgi:hypothetical protein